MLVEIYDIDWHTGGARQGTTTAISLLMHSQLTDTPSCIQQKAVQNTFLLEESTENKMNIRSYPAQLVLDFT